jgi:hypothetical protein
MNVRTHLKAKLALHGVDNDYNAEYVLAMLAVCSPEINAALSGNAEDCSFLPTMEVATAALALRYA